MSVGNMGVVYKGESYYAVFGCFRGVRPYYNGVITITCSNRTVGGLKRLFWGLW